MSSLRIAGPARRREWGGALLLVPLGLLVGVVVTDLLTPPDFHLAPFLAVAPALTAVFAGPRATAVMGALALLALVIVALARHALSTEDVYVQLCGLALIAAFMVFFRVVGDRRNAQLFQSRTVASVAQEVLLRPLPGRSGPLSIASLYLAAEREATMGGDFYGAARTDASTRLLCGDVRGSGLPAVREASSLLGAFRAASHQQTSLPRLAKYLDDMLRWDAAQWSGGEVPAEVESFATGVLLDVPDDGSFAGIVSLGHPPPLLVRGGRVTLVESDAALPFGLGSLKSVTAYDETKFGFDSGDLLLLYTDGVTEARDGSGAFYPLVERIASWHSAGPAELLRRLRADLMDFVGGRLRDDAAAVAIRHC